MASGPGVPLRISGRMDRVPKQWPEHALERPFTARMKKLSHRARTGLRKSAVDYFRGDGSDWIALAGLLLTIPLIACGTR